MASNPQTHTIKVENSVFSITTSVIFETFISVFEWAGQSRVEITILWSYKKLD